MENTIPISKIDEDKRLVFGFFNINKVGDSLVEDLQGDIIETEDLEKAAYDFVLNARVAGEGHIRKGVGQLVESFMITKEKESKIVETLKSIGVEAKMDLGVEGLWGGFYISDDDVWSSITKGDYPMFSIGGSGQRIPVEEEDNA